MSDGMGDYTRLKKYDDFEIDEIGQFVHPSDGCEFEECLDGYDHNGEFPDSNIEEFLVNTYWSVFGHLKEGGRECICDVKTKDEAQFIENIFSLALVAVDESEYETKKFWGEE